jgi:hypothetical protein
MLLSFVFATMEELGYSPIIQRRCDTNNRLCLVFKVRDKYFKTLACVSEHPGNVIRDRATRVYRAQEIASFDDLIGLGEPVILKYAWISVKELTECSIQNKIFAELDALAGQLGDQDAEKPAHLLGLNPELQSIVLEKLQDEEYKKHFITIICDGQGMTCKPVASNSRPSGDLFVDPSIKFALSTLRFGNGMRSMHNPHDEDLVASNDIDRRFCKFAPKQQSFTVFNEVGVVLHNVSKFSEVLQAMMDCYIGEHRLGDSHRHER